MIAIESSFGLGETVVGGTVTPDHFLVDKVDARGRRDARSPTSTSSSSPTCRGGVIEREVEPERRAQPVAHRRRRSARSPRWPSAPSSTTASRRTSSGRSTPTATRPPAAEPSRDGLVQAARTPARPSVQSGPARSLVDTLVNPLASRRSTDVDAARLSASSARTRTRRRPAPRAGRSCTRTTSLPRGPPRDRGGASSGSPTSQHWPRGVQALRHDHGRVRLQVPRPVQHAPLPDPARERDRLPRPQRLHLHEPGRGARRRRSPRACPQFLERAGHYFANWPTLLENWERKIERVIAELEAIDVRAAARPVVPRSGSSRARASTTRSR